MTFRLWRTRLATCLLLSVALAAAGCRHRLSEAEKQTRAELRQALQNHDYANAESLARRVLETASTENGAWERLVWAQLGRRDIDGAKQSLGDWARRVRKPSAKLAEYAGDIALQEHDPAAAIEAWKRALMTKPKQARLLRKLAQLQDAEHRWADEDATLTRLLALGENARDRMAHALCLRRLHHWPEAMAEYRRAQELAPGDPKLATGVQLFQRVSKFLSELHDLDARIALTPADDQLLADRALLALRGEDGEMALEDSEAAAKAAQWAMRPRILQAIALLQLGRANEQDKLGITPGLRLESLSAEFLQTISRLDSEISVERSNAELYVSRAWQLNDIGQPTLAIEDAENALRFDPNSAGAHAELGYANSKLGRVDEAIAGVTRASELDPNFSTGWQYRGELEMSRGDFVAAVESFTRALAISQTPAVLQKREECYRQLGLLTKADEDHRALDALNSQRSPPL